MKIPWGFLSMLGLVVVREGVVKKHELDSLSSLVEASWRHASDAAGREGVGASVLAFGDSLVKNGISPPALQSGTGRSAYNLATFGGPPAFSYFMLRRVLQAGGKPDTLILVFMPANLASCPQVYVQMWQAIASPRECLDLALVTRDASFSGVLISGRLLPSVRNRLEIREWARQALLGKAYTHDQIQASALDRRGWRENRGAHLVRMDEPHTPIASRLADPYVFPAAWTCDPAEAVYVQRFLKLARARGINVVCLLPPVLPVVQALRERYRSDEHYTTLVRNLQARHPEIVVADARYSRYPATLFMDNVHLNSRGATRLSTDLAGFLRTLRVGDRPRASWANLPRDREDLAGRHGDEPGRPRATVR